MDEITLGDHAKLMDPKMHAAVNAGESVADILAEGVGDVESRTIFGETALHRAVRAGSLDTVNELLEAGAEIDGRDALGKTSLMTVCSTKNKKWTAGHQKVAMRLLELGADPCAIDSKNSTALIRACQEGHINVVVALLKAGVPHDTPDNDGKTPLIAAAHAHSKIIEILLRKDVNAQFRKHKVANVKHQDQNGKTALMYAAAGKNVAGVKMLIDAGSDPFVECNKGKTALKYCKKSPEAEEKINAAMVKASGGGKRR